MKRGSLTILVLFVGCSPNFQSGKTLCSDKGECPSGYVCSYNGAGAPRVCVNAPTSGTGGSGGNRDAGGGSNLCGATLVTSACQDLVNSPTADACTACLMSQCCGPAADCANDTNCATKSTGPLWNTLTACFTGCCDTGCSTLTGDAGVPDTLPPNTSTCSLSQMPLAGGTCNVFPACGCPTGQVCHADIEATGLACTANGTLADGADCSSAQVCASGLGCFGSMCSRYCDYDWDCPAVDTVQSCVQTTWSSGNSISGVSVCARVCDPVSPRSPRSPLLACPAGFGCYSDIYGASDCQKQAGTGVAGSSCSTDPDCSPGYYCSTSGSCVKYCFTNANCPIGKTCNFFSTANYAGSSEVGYCY
jgi:hypothetical protein